MKLYYILLISLLCIADGVSESISESSPVTKRLTEFTMNKQLKEMEYAVRGKVVIAADRIAEELDATRRSGIKVLTRKYSFDRIIYTNIGNPHSVGQKPLTWPRQVLALVELPAELGVDHPLASQMFPVDAIARAREIKQGLGLGGAGAYSHSQGVLMFRKDVADFIHKRDGVESNPEDIFLTNGASSGIEMILTALIADKTCGIMIPIPQYPIYTALIALLGGQGMGYYLDENNKWSLNIEHLEQQLEESKERGINPVCFVLINPGNPTGQVLSKEVVKNVVDFCARHNLVLLADEVYQENIYNKNDQFYSCKKAAHDLNLLDEIELVSFHSTSKGFYGECGRRGGYMEMVGIDPFVKEQIYKLASSSLCSAVSGQMMTSLMVRGPSPGDISYESHENEKKSIFESLKRRSRIVSDGLNNIPGFSCTQADGAMYCFPKVELPLTAQKAAQSLGMSPDTLYCVSLLEHTGICVVPASGFGQEAGRFGFRTTFLPDEEEMLQVVQRIVEHHEVFLRKYSP